MFRIMNIDIQSFDELHVYNKLYTGSPRHAAVEKQLKYKYFTSIHNNYIRLIINE